MSITTGSAPTADVIWLICCTIAASQCYVQPRAYLWQPRRSTGALRPTKSCGTTARARFPVRTRLSLQSRKACGPIVALELWGQLWVSLSCPTAACGGHRSRTGAGEASRLGPACGFACDASKSCRLPVCKSLNSCQCGGRSDMRAGNERWVCNRCPLAGHTRPLSLAALLPGPPQLEHSRQLSTQRPSAGSVARAPVLPTAPGPAAHCVFVGPPDLPLRAPTYSCVYVPLLLDAAGLLASEARNAWHTHPAFAPWWPGTVQALLARPSLSVRHVADVARAAVAVAAPEHAASFAGLLAWTAGTAGPMTSLAELVRHISRGERGYYIPEPVQELLLTILLGEAEAAALARRLDGLRPMPAGPSQPPAPPAQALAEPPAAPPAPSARPRLLLTWGNVTPTGADAPNQAEAGIATPCTARRALPVHWRAGRPGTVRLHHRRATATATAGRHVLTHLRAALAGCSRHLGPARAATMA